MILTGLLGQACAQADAGIATTTATTRTSAKNGKRHLSISHPTCFYFFRARREIFSAARNVVN
ncbi:MAG TPA: hypothetical protein VGM57_04770 [Pseudolabrys sp.]